MSRKECFILTLVLCIHFQIINESEANLQHDLDTFKVQKLINLLGERNLSRYSEKDSRSEKRWNISSPCFNEIYHFMLGLSKAELWALKMLDASSKIHSGILTGHLIDLGMYDECLAIRENKNGTEIRGRHCMYGLKHKIASLRLSVCVPASCKAEDVEHLLGMIIFNITNIGSVGIDSISSTSCSRIDPLEWTLGSIVTLTVFGIIFCFLLFCTFLDLLIVQRNIQNAFVTNLAKFSMYRSTLQILHTKVNPATIPVLNGIRVLSIFWIVMGHVYEFRLMEFLTVNTIDIIEWYYSWNAIYVVIIQFAVDTFFTLSGFLIAYFFMKETSKGRKINIFTFYFHRYIRLTPALLAILLFSKYIIPHLGSGPVWEEDIGSGINCEGTWWTILIYLQNFIHENNFKQCIGQSWYLAVDMQLFLISPIILYPLSKKKKLGLIIWTIIFITSLLVPPILIAIKEYPASIMSTTQNENHSPVEAFYKFYAAPHVRAGPWIVGIFFGFLTATKSLTLNRKRSFLGWFITLCGFVFCVVGSRSFMKKDYKYDIVWEAIFGSLARPLWGLSICWIIIASIQGYAGPIAKILSLPIFLPFSRISYCIYLIHQQLIIILKSTARTNVYFSDFELIQRYIGDLTLSIIFAFFFTLLFESPIMILEKMIFRREKKVEPSKSIT